MQSHCKVSPPICTIKRRLLDGKFSRGKDNLYSTINFIYMSGFSVMHLIFILLNVLFYHFGSSGYWEIIPNRFSECLVLKWVRRSIFLSFHPLIPVFWIQVLVNIA